MDRKRLNGSTFKGGAIGLAALGALAFVGAASLVRGPAERAERVRWPEPRPAASSLLEVEAADRLPALRREAEVRSDSSLERVEPAAKAEPARALRPGGRLGEPPPISAELMGPAPDAMRDAAGSEAGMGNSASASRGPLGASSSAFLSMPSAAPRSAGVSQAFRGGTNRRLGKLHSIGVVHALPTNIRALSTLTARAPKTAAATSSSQASGTSTPAGAVGAPASALASGAPQAAQAAVASGSSASSGGVTAKAAAASGDPAISPQTYTIDINSPPREFVFEITGLDPAKTTVCYEVESHPLFDKQSDVRSKTCKGIGDAPYIMPFMKNGKYGNEQWSYENGKWTGRFAWDPSMWATNGIKTHFVFADATTKKSVDGYIRIVQNRCNALQCGADRRVHYGFDGFSPRPPGCTNQKVGDACAPGMGCMLPAEIATCPIEWRP